MAERKQHIEYADPTQALSHYLDDLLQSATQAGTVEQQAPAESVVSAEPIPAPEQAPPRVSSEERAERRQRAREKAERVRARRQAVATSSPAPDIATLADDSLKPAEINAETELAATSPGAQENLVPALTAPEGRPQWADSPFECLLFRVAGLQLAVPLVLLGAIHRIESDIHELPGRPGWFMGILSTPHANLRVVDTAKWVMPGREPESAQAGYQFVIRLDDSEWGLACDDVAQSFRLTPDDVKWRSERSRRPWLAGTVIDHMCALVDVRTMSSLLSRAEKDQHLDITG